MVDVWKGHSCGRDRGEPHAGQVEEESKRRWGAPWNTATGMGEDGKALPKLKGREYSSSLWPVLEILGGWHRRIVKLIRPFLMNCSRDCCE